MRNFFLNYPLSAQKCHILGAWGYLTEITMFLLLGAHKRIRYPLMSPCGIYWNPNIFVSEEPMQNFVTLAAFFLLEKKGPQKKEEIEKNL